MRMVWVRCGDDLGSMIWDFLSESGFTGFMDFQNIINKIYFILNVLWR